MIMPTPVIVLHKSQIFLQLPRRSMFCQKVRPSGLTGFVLFVSIASMFLSAFMLLVPWYMQYDNFARLAHVLKEDRVMFMNHPWYLPVWHLAFSWHAVWEDLPGCKNADNNLNAELEWCLTKGLGGWWGSSEKAGSRRYLACVWLLARLWYIAALQPAFQETARWHDPPFEVYNTIQNNAGIASKSFYRHKLDLESWWAHWFFGKHDAVILKD